MDPVTVRFGRRIRQLRLAIGLTQEQLAKAAGMDAKHIGVIERGVKSSSFSAVGRLAKALRVDIHELFLPDGTESARGSAAKSPELADFRKVPRHELEQFVKELAIRIRRLRPQ
jgi:transcriptional regulator with XRE-family HTH domain